MAKATAVTVCLRRRRALSCKIFISVLALRQTIRVFVLASVGAEAAIFG
jgi:hypothetical protein